jgi:hypothetical protein
MLSEKQRQRIVVRAIRRVRRKAREQALLFAEGKISWSELCTAFPFVTHTGKPAARVGRLRIETPRGVRYADLS